jgi:trehalose 6-phosphate phosphatase
MPRILFDHLSDIQSLLREYRRVLLFLDFDGTLTPIVDFPDQAVMLPRTRVTLRRLRDSGTFSITIVSGRALNDIRERVGMAGLTYAGNHGLEIWGEGLNFVEPEAVQRIKVLGELSRRLRERLRHIPGVEVENKVLTASVHFRRAERGSLDEIRKAVHAELAFSENIFRVTRGLQVIEVRPRVDWNKGTAVRWIQQASASADTLSVYVGDDATDEDAFAALPEGVTVRVGHAKRTAAGYYLDDQKAVTHFLAWLGQASVRGVASNPAQREPAATIAGLEP